MSVSIPAAVIGAAAIGTAGSVAGGAISAAGAGQQATASENAAQLQYQEQQQALAQENQQFQQEQTNEQPFLNAGQGAVTSLSGLLSTPGQGLLQPWTQQFTAPSAAEAAAQPGYQFSLQQGLNALQNSAAAQGSLLSSGTQKALNNYAQQAGQTDYQNAYNNALTGYNSAYNTFQNNQSNTFNRLASVAGLGQTTAAQLGQAGAQNAGTVANTLLTGGAQQGQDLQNAAAATASGYTALGNSVGSAAGGVGQTALLASLLNGSFGSSGTTTGINGTGAGLGANAVPSNTLLGGSAF
jgi:hypothetical protein